MINVKEEQKASDLASLPKCGPLPTASLPPLLFSRFGDEDIRGWRCSVLCSVPYSDEAKKRSLAGC